MSTFVALLRGINVGGRASVPMAELRSLCGELGFDGVRTYIQSGNVVFRAQGEETALARTLSAGIRRHFGHDVPVMVRRPEALEEVVARHPFADGAHPESALHVGFLSEAPQPARLTDLPPPPPGPERFVVEGLHCYLLYPEGVGRSKLTGAWLERALGTPLTMRNWRTVRRLLEMAQEA